MDLPKYELGRFAQEPYAETACPLRFDRTKSRNAHDAVASVQIRVETVTVDFRESPEPECSDRCENDREGRDTRRFEAPATHLPSWYGIRQNLREPPG